MVDELENALFKSAAVLSCKYLVLKICEGLSMGLATQKNSLGEESGPFARKPGSLSESIANLIQQFDELVIGKSRIHSVLYGDDTDKRIVGQIYSTLRRVESDIASPLRTLIEQTGEEDILRPRVRELSKVAGEIWDQMQTVLAEAKMRFEIASLDHFRAFASRWKSTDAPVTSEWTVVSIDKTSYTRGALALESLTGAQAVLEHNREILALIKKAVGSSGASTDEVLIHSTGDGALLYFRDANAAVRSCIAVHTLARESSLRLPDPQWVRRFRIGISTGMACVCTSRALHGEVLHHEAGGAAIIDAVRIEAKCDARSIWADFSTVQKIERDLQRQFSEPEKMDSKPEEGRQLTICKYVW